MFAAMSALEIMDPKMDSGIERSGYYSIEEAIEDGIAPVPLSLDRTLDIQRTLDVIDHLFSCNMAQGSHSSTDRLYMYLPYENGENFIACCPK